VEYNAVVPFNFIIMFLPLKHKQNV